MAVAEIILEATARREQHKEEPYGTKEQEELHRGRAARTDVGGCRNRLQDRCLRTAVRGEQRKAGRGELHPQPDRRVQRVYRQLSVSAADGSLFRQRKDGNRF